MIGLRGICKAFGRYQALRGVTIDFEPGKMTALLGPNGSGKTTAIKTLLGLVRPNAGAVEWNGRHINGDFAFREEIGYMPQIAHFPENLTIREFLAMIGDIRRTRPVRYSGMMERFELAALEAKPLKGLSGGTRQRVCAVMALMFDVPMYILDEPTAGLDPLAAAGFRDDLVEMVRRDGTTVFLTTHNLTEAERLCQQVGVIRAGRLLAAGRTDELRQRARSQPLVSFVGRGFDERVAAMLRARPEVQGVRRLDSTLHVELRAGAETSPLVAAIVNAGAEVEEVRKARATLEDLFLDLVDDTNAAAPNDARETTPC